MAKKIVFMGTPMFAVPILKSLYQNGYPISDVYTQPPQKSKRGQKINKSPIQGIAETLNLDFRTPKYLKETEAQDIRFRGFGTQIPGGLKANFLKMPANPANTSTIYHGGRLLALNEGGKPWELDPDNLETLGEFTYDGGLEPSMVFSAHGKVHPRTGDYINFGAGVSGFGFKGPKPCLNVYRVDRDGQMAEKHQVSLDNFPFCHDFALSDRYAIFFLGSIVFGNMLPVVLGTRTISVKCPGRNSHTLRSYEQTTK